MPHMVLLMAPQVVLLGAWMAIAQVMPCVEVGVEPSLNESVELLHCLMADGPRYVACAVQVHAASPGKIQHTLSAAVM